MGRGKPRVPASGVPYVARISTSSWHAQVVREGFVSEQLKRAALAKAERVQEEMDQQRPKRETLSREAGRWPRDSPARWLGRKGQLMVKRSGVFGQLPFGIGHHYTCVGTSGAEPEKPVQTCGVPLPFAPASALSRSIVAGCSPSSAAARPHWCLCGYPLARRRLAEYRLGHSVGRLGCSASLGHA